MDTRQFWKLIEDARSQVPDPADLKAIVTRASILLAAYPREEIVAAHQVFWDLMGASYQVRLWAAAFLINGGCSDDGFEYFRGWLVIQGRQVFGQAVANPDSLADLPIIRVATAGQALLECEDALSIARNAYMTATGEKLPADASSFRYPKLDSASWFDFNDRTEMEHRLPRLAKLCLS